MRQEDEALMMFFLEQQAEERQEANEEEVKSIKIEEVDLKWKALMMANEMEKQQIIEQLMEAAIIRGTKGKKKKGKKGGKK